MATTWDAVELDHEAELVEEGEALERVLEAARHREGAAGAPTLKVVSSVLAYWAAPYEGGADLLAPSWFIELAHPATRRAAPVPGSWCGSRPSPSNRAACALAGAQADAVA